MKFYFLIGLVCLSCSTSKTAEKLSRTPSEIQSITTSGNHLSDIYKIPEHIKALSSNEMLGRTFGSASGHKAADYIANYFNDLPGLQPLGSSYKIPFRVGELTGYNVVAELPGNDPELRDEYILIGAHFDHIGIIGAVEGDSIANGANDNASGTTAVMALASYFAKAKSNKRSILFVAFDGEETGLKGSFALAELIAEQEIDLYLMINFEMIGVAMTGRDYMAYITGYDLTNLAEVFNSYSGAQILGSLPEAKKYQLFQRSDNYPFYAKVRIPAQTISTFDFTNYDYYHHVDDEFELMDIDHMKRFIQACIPGLTGIINSPPETIKLL